MYYRFKCVQKENKNIELQLRKEILKATLYQRQSKDNKIILSNTEVVVVLSKFYLSESI